MTEDQTMLEVPEAKLIVVSGNDRGREFDLPALAEGKATVSLGRGAEVDIRLNDARVSRLHAEIKVDRSRYVVADKGSSNGTFVNSELIKGPRVLKDGDVLAVGDTQLTFRMKARGKGAGAAARRAGEKKEWGKPRKSESREKAEKAPAGRAPWIVLGVVAVVLILGVAIVLGVLSSRGRSRGEAASALPEGSSREEAAESTEKPITLKPGEAFTIQLEGVEGQKVKIEAGKATGGKRDIKIIIEDKKRVGKEEIHTVVPGDTLWDIARRYLGTPLKYPKIARDSGIENPDLIYPGDRIRIIYVEEE